jgi:putative Ca2+/H+ antiporter (TMEM165/GDT1 family)
MNFKKEALLMLGTFIAIIILSLIAVLLGPWLIKK